ncbi:MAG TPA: LytTR family DNA-binding domain-containing protein [Puia sp.]|nr:LytTR family DNA-binding domain-containing protein [Puia sp.]
MKGKTNKSNIIYKDIPFFLILIPFINALNYHLTYNKIPFNWHTVLTFTIDTLQGYLAWFSIRSIIIFLDKKLSYKPNPIKRILLQLLLTSIAGLATIIITTEILNAIASDKPVPSGFFSFDIFIFLIWFFVINGIYVGWHYYALWNESEKLRTEEKKIRQDGFIVKQGRQSFNITVAEIAAIYVEGNYSMLLTFDLKKHLLDQSLDKVEKQLPEEFFFRVNRQYILQRKIITGFESADNGKINVLTANDHFPEAIQISRIKAAAFKSWFKLEN